MYLYNIILTNETSWPREKLSYLYRYYILTTLLYSFLNAAHKDISILSFRSILIIGNLGANISEISRRDESFKI